MRERVDGGRASGALLEMCGGSGIASRRRRHADASLSGFSALLDFRPLDRGMGQVPDFVLVPKYGERCADYNGKRWAHQVRNGPRVSVPSPGTDEGKGPSTW